MITRKFPQFDDKIVHISLFKNVQNASEIRKEMMAGNQDYSYAFVAASTIVSLEHLLAGVYRAVNDNDAGNMRTKTIHSEVVYCLSPNNNIMDSLKRFGITDSTDALFAVKIADKTSTTDYHDFLTKHINGSEVEVTNGEISQITDEAVVKKNYKVAPQTDLIIPAITLRGF